MGSVRWGGCLVLFLACQGATVTPVEKVVQLLEGLTSEIEKEGSEEAKSYDEFACFCKDKNDWVSTKIKEGNDQINTQSATIGKKTAEKEETQTDLAQRKAKQETLASDLQEEIARCEKEQNIYETNAADLSKAISSAKAAMDAMSGSKSASFLDISASVGQTLALAEAMNMIKDTKSRAVAAFLQEGAGVDPEDPQYKFHSQGIIDVIQKLRDDFVENKQELDNEWEKTRQSCEDTKADLKSQMAENAGAMEQCETKIEELVQGIASTRVDLVNQEAELKDDKLYLKDLTERCETRAGDWDQRSALRGKELNALTAALEILKGKVSETDTAVNKRTLLLQHGRMTMGVSLLQSSAEKVEAHVVNQAVRVAASLEHKKDTVLAFLEQQGRRLNSPVLSTLAMRAAADPFLKVKELIQKLIERLIKEATEEATKKGFCDTEMGKATKERDFRYEEVNKLSVELAALEVKADELNQEIDDLTSSTAALNEALKETTDDRKTEKEENAESLATAKEGLTAVKQAILILKSFYKEAAKAKVFLQVSASPLDDDGVTSTQGSTPGFEGAYKGKQDNAGGIIGLLAVIKTDFERTLRSTEAAEKKSAADFVLFDRDTKANIAGKTTKKELDEQDLETTKTTKASKKTDMKTNMNLLDAALAELEELNPVCVDTGMSYKERVEAREKEMEALKSAMCMLDTDNVEPECSQ